MTKNYDEIVRDVCDTVIRAGSTFREDKKTAYRKALENETSNRARWVMDTIIQNSEVAETNCSPLCDDTGIPHILLEVGTNSIITGQTIDAINDGVAMGLRKLPGRPMAINGNERERIEQSGGLNDDPAAVLAAPVLIRKSREDLTRLHVLMFGGGPAIRAKTYRIFHKHDTQVVLDEIVEWAIGGVSKLGCSPCTLAVGIGRSHYEASALMLQAQVDGDYGIQSEMEREITQRVNEANIGPLGLGGRTSVLATFMKVGPQRASGVRIVCLRPCCCFEPRIASVVL